MAVITLLKNHYERNGLVVDREVRDSFVFNIPKALEASNEDCEEFVREQQAYCDAGDNGWEKLENHSSVFVELSKKLLKGESAAWGKVSQNFVR
jgi:hypothetical protein